MFNFDRRHLPNTDLNAVIEHQQQLITRLSYNRGFGCLTRQALDILLEEMPLEGLAIVYWDIDGLKQKNDPELGGWGKEESNRRINDSIQARGTDCVAGQVHSGDEFIAFPPAEDAVSMAQRILERLWQNEMSATFYITLPRPNENPDEMLVRVGKGCDRFKQAGLRGQIHVEEK